ncbi:MAG: metallophosphoesterase [Limnohabitans sp.]|nr:metallophosphoesterase [Limnohabitans sp.]
MSNITNPLLALWKSSVAKVLAQSKNKTHLGAFSSDEVDALFKATNNYCNLVEANQTPQDPGKDSDDEEKVNTYLSHLYHIKAHAKIDSNEIKEKELEAEIAEYKFGNPLWQQMFIEYYKYYWDYPHHKGAVPQYRSWKDSSGGNGDINYGVVQWKIPSNARIAIVGDIGTGTEEAKAVLAAACKFKPDVFLHLGDIYYSGTEEETQQRLVKMVKEVLQKENCEVPFYTIPGNHEYFTGNVSLLKALDSNVLVNTEEQRQQTSYFCLKTEDESWQFLGMDTGYNGHYMNVEKGANANTLKLLHIDQVDNPPANSDAHWPKDYNPYFPETQEKAKDTTSNVAMITIRTDEQEWHTDKLNSFSGKTILLSHHQLYSANNTCGVAQEKKSDGSVNSNDPNRPWVNTALWKQFGSFLGDKVPLWLWGHEHNLEIFKDNYRPEDWPTDTDFANTYKNLPKGRCAGHSALPVENTENPYQVNYPVPLLDENLKLGMSQVGDSLWYNHGFQLLELKGKDNAARLSFFEITIADNTVSPIHVEYIK